MSPATNGSPPSPLRRVTGRVGLGITLLLGAHGVWAVPSTVAKEHAAVTTQSVARQSATGHNAGRKPVVDQRQSFAKHSVASQSRAHVPLAKQDVAGQRPARKELASQSAARQRASHPMRLHAPKA